MIYKLFVYSLIKVKFYQVSLLWDIYDKIEVTKASIAWAAPKRFILYRAIIFDKVSLGNFFYKM